MEAGLFEEYKILKEYCRQNTKLGNKSVRMRNDIYVSAFCLSLIRNDNTAKSKILGGPQCILVWPLSLTEDDYFTTPTVPNTMSPDLPTTVFLRYVQKSMLLVHLEELTSPY